MNENRLQLYLTESLKKVTDKKMRRVSDQIIATLPDFVKALHETILDPQATKSSRTSALSMLNSLIVRLESSKRRPSKKYKPKVDGMTEEQRTEDFAQRLTHISDETADALHRTMQSANERWRIRYHGLGGQ